MPSKRYLGSEPCTFPGQVVDYLAQNYADAEGKPMPREVAREIADAHAEQIQRGIRVFRSNVYYLGDEAMKDVSGWTGIPEPDEDKDEE